MGNSKVLLVSTALSLLFSINSYAIPSSTIAGEQVARASKPKPNPAPVTPTPSPDPAPNAPAPTGDLFETCFSPTESCDQKIITFIGAAKSTLDIAIYSITHDGIVQAINSAKGRGVKIRMVVDRSQSKGVHSLVQTLISDGIDLKIGNFQGIMHDKFTIVDGIFLETGSYNYTQNATVSNGENQLYLNNASVIQRYQSNFETMWANALTN